MLVQDRLSTGGSFILCDALAVGFPIRYASQGFVDLFGFKASECIGKKCGDLVGSPSIYAHDADLKALTAAHGVSHDMATEGLKAVTERAQEECRKMAADPTAHMGFALVVNRKSDGDLFVCEVLMQISHHTGTGWPYSVGFQSDITDDISVAELLKSAANGKLDALIASRNDAKNKHLENLCLKDKQVASYLNDKAEEMWYTLLNCIDATGKPAPQSIASLSTKDKMSETGGLTDTTSISSMTIKGADSASVVSDEDFNQGSLASWLWGSWSGKMAGGGMVAMQFFSDGHRVLITMSGKVIQASYRLDSRRDMVHLDIFMPRGSGDKDELRKCIVKIDANGLHFCWPSSAGDRASRFEGPGFLLMQHSGDELSMPASKTAWMPLAMGAAAALASGVAIGVLLRRKRQM